MENIDVNVSVEMHNASEPRLPSVGIKPLNLDEGLTYFLLTIVPITLFIGLPLLYEVSCIFRYIYCFIHNKLTKLCKKCKMVDCSTELKWIDRSKACDECAGSCKCTHKVTEL